MEQLENRMIIDDEENKKIYCRCEQCGEDIYYGDEIVIDELSGNIMHDYCKDEYIDDFIDNNFTETIAEEE
ncbi:MAG: hypothetical protein HFJ55_02180 [Clostridia bacterium]|nr:hypothetical protein [Clostridia bacterium]